MHNREDRDGRDANRRVSAVPADRLRQPPRPSRLPHHRAREEHCLGGPPQAHAEHLPKEDAKALLQLEGLGFLG
jgi:hypothetical protein